MKQIELNQSIEGYTDLGHIIPAVVTQIHSKYMTQLKEHGSIQGSMSSGISERGRITRNARLVHR
jgi:hypothetical protein